MSERRYSNAGLISELRRPRHFRDAAWPGIMLSDLLPFCDDFETLEQNRADLEAALKVLLSAFETIYGIGDLEIQPAIYQANRAIDSVKGNSE